jgi:hypothetical protein
MKSLAFAVVLAALCASPLSAQLCPPTVLPSGQPALPFVPPCFGLLPPPAVWAAGNAGFAISSFAPAPVPAGFPTLLLVGFTSPALPVGAPLLPAFVLPGFLNNAAGIFALPAGPSGPVPGLPVPFPLPATGGPLPFTVTVQTLVVLPVGFALTAGTDVVI